MLGAADAAMELAPRIVTDSMLKLFLLLVSMAVFVLLAVNFGGRMHTLLLHTASTSI